MVDISNIFGMYLRELRDFADGNIITHITQLSIQHIGVAPQVADILTFALADQRTPPTYKKPLFYVIDSILKRAGGPYNYLFQQRLAAAFPAMIGNVPDEDRRKISTMLGTWRERNFFSEEFLNNLQGQLMSIRVSLKPSLFSVKSTAVATVPPINGDHFALNLPTLSPFKIVIRVAPLLSYRSRSCLRWNPPSRTATQPTNFIMQQ